VVFDISENILLGRSNQMEKKNFTATIELAKSSQDVFKAITDDVPKWWGGKDLEGSSTKL
jgi:uncharacterized protein YndB with AHSA1/START domain